jgi:hypothetical protein
LAAAATRPAFRPATPPPPLPRFRGSRGIRTPNSRRFRPAPLVSILHVQHLRAARFLPYWKPDHSPRSRRKHHYPRP